MTGSELKKLREKKGLSQMEVAYNCKMSIPTLSNLENEKPSTKIGDIKTVQEYLINLKD